MLRITQTNANDPAGSGISSPVLKLEGKWAEIETVYREALATQTGLLGGANSGQGSVPINIMYLLMRGHRYDAVEQALNEVLTPAFQREPQCAELLRARAEFQASRGRWKEAAAPAKSCRAGDSRNKISLSVDSSRLHPHRGFAAAIPGTILFQARSELDQAPSIWNADDILNLK